MSQLFFGPINHHFVHLAADLHAGELGARDRGNLPAVRNAMDGNVIGTTAAWAHDGKIATDGVGTGLHLVLTVAVVTVNIHAATAAKAANQGPVDARLGHTLGSASTGSGVSAQRGFSLAAASTNAREGLGDGEERLGLGIRVGDVDNERAIRAAADTLEALRAFHTEKIIALGLAITVGTGGQFTGVVHAILDGLAVHEADVVTILGLETDQLKDFDLARNQDATLGGALGAEIGLVLTHIGKIALDAAVIDT